MSESNQKSYSQVLKTSALIGASSLANIGLGIVRTKAMALMLGPAGFGVLGLFSLIIDITRSVAGLGINTSGVRQIAEAVGSGDEQRIGATVTALRRVALITGALGSLILLILCKPVAQLSFGNDQNASAVALLALAVFFADISSAQAALVQGMRKIADLARMNVLGGVYGTVLGVLVVYIFGAKGMAASLVCVSGMSILTSWWYARKIKVRRVRLTLRELAAESSELLKLGIVFMTTALVTMGAAYVTRIILLRQIGTEAAGFYQAAWTLGGLYVGFILQAMGADFYPRLTAVANNNPECNRLVNEQTEVGLLMAGPGVTATFVFAPFVIDLFYSTKFQPAAELLCWICLGMLWRVVCWPMGFIVLAKGKRAIFFWSEITSNTLQVGLVGLGVFMVGLNGAGIGFFMMYAAYGGVTYLIARKLSGFRWSPANRRLVLIFFPLALAVFALRYVLPPLPAMILGIAGTVFASAYSLWQLCSIVPPAHLPHSVRKILKALRLTPPLPQGAEE